jgi:hypothetical protein
MLNLEEKLFCTPNKLETGAARRKYAVGKTNVRHWRGAKANILSCKKSTMSYSGPRRERHPEMYVAVLTYFRELRNKGMHITKEVLMLNGKTMCRN